LLGWLSWRLGWAPKKGSVRSGSQLAWQFDAPSGPIEIAVHRADDGLAQIEAMHIEWRGSGNQVGGHVDYRHEGHHIRHFPDDPALRPSSIPTLDQRLEQMVAAQLAHRAGDPLFSGSIVYSEAMAEVLVLKGQLPRS
jgi:hypothetical protein